MADTHADKQPEATADEQPGDVDMVRAEVGKQKVEMMLPKHVIRRFQTIVDMLTALDCEDGGVEDELIPLPGVEPPVLRRVLEFADSHGDALRDDALAEWKRQPVPDEDKRWLDMSTLEGVNHTVAFLRACNFLNYACGLQHACRAMASMITATTPDKILTLMGHAPTLTAEEIARAKETYEWLAHVQVPPELMAEPPSQ